MMAFVMRADGSVSAIKATDLTTPNTGNDYKALVDVLLLCTRCKQPIKARINTPNWIRCEWIGPWGECLKCFQETKKEVKDGGDCCHFQD